MRIAIFSVILLSFLSVSPATSSEIIETWICQEYPYGNWSNILVTAKVNKGRNDGVIEVAGVQHKSKFAIKGFERRWDFVPDNDFAYNYAFVIKPNGAATYYDFSGSKSGDLIKPSIVLYCKQKGT
jgi:hypothetical protein